VLGIDEAAAEPKELTRDIFDLAAIVITVGLLGLVVAGAVGLPRVVLAVAFAFFVPGRAIVSNWPRLAYWSEFGMSMVVSLAILTMAATTILWAHRWHPVGLFEIEAGLSVVALPIGLARRHRRTAQESAEPGEPPRAADSAVDSAGPTDAEVPPAVVGASEAPADAQAGSA
jgi:uncharacterized membrane protein